MNKTENKTTVKAAHVNLNTEALDTVDGNDLLDTVLPTTIEGTSLDKASKYVELNEQIIQTNHFLLMLQIAFNQHKPIAISPDDLWLLICQGFSEHIKLYSEDFKDIFGVDERQTIQVRRDDFVIGDDNPWEDVFPEFSKKIAQSINEDLYSNIILNFSTSTKKEINAFEIAFMDSMSSYFDYEFITICGIPEIEIRGTIEDYHKIINALEGLKKYNLDWWINAITPKINKIIETLKGEANFEFWNSIYKENDECGGPIITGWIADFFPYLKTRCLERNGVMDYDEHPNSKLQVLKTTDIEDASFDDYEKHNIHTVLIKNPRLTDYNDYPLKLDNFPSGLSTVPFKWQYFDKALEMNFVSGFIGIKESELNNTLNTDINWIVYRN
ncbi:DUF4419 domain-containing protein [Seonamhaeicola sp.]|uniref:DUF4419 domain-containing protein n=1 Tax=Seonamhaeicola sp. TaxID=1912245 RepID=UPI00260AF3C0|nr:DUF4419 domain-containing protein [Seonamhaeicola sp.]